MSKLLLYYYDNKPNSVDSRIVLEQFLVCIGKYLYMLVNMYVR